MQSLLLDTNVSKSTAFGISGLLLVLFVLGIAIAVVTVVAFVMRAIVFFKYHSLNRKQSASGVPVEQAVRQVLDANGLNDVQVQKAGFFRWLLFGNHYSVRKKTIFLKKNIMGKSTTTALGIGLQKVGLAMQHKNKEKGFKARYAFQMISMYSPFIFYAIVIAGLVIDFLTGFNGLGSVVGVAIGLAYYVAVFLCLLFTIKVEKKANAQAIYMIEQSGLLPPEDIEDLKSLFAGYLTIYILDFVISILKIIYYILKILLQGLLRKTQK